MGGESRIRIGDPRSRSPCLRHLRTPVTLTGPDGGPAMDDLLQQTLESATAEVALGPTGSANGLVFLLVAALGLLMALHRKLGGLPLRGWARDTALLLGAAVLAGGAAWALAQGVGWPTGLWGRLLQTSLGSTLALGLYGLLAAFAPALSLTQPPVRSPGGCARRP